MDEQSLRAEYRLLCDRQSELRRELYDIGCRKAMLACRITRAVFGHGTNNPGSAAMKQPTGHDIGGEGG